ncbi:Protein CBG07421 [Caenorhabditis briggsae]|uniref:Protein CBG07421 n=1 Tax=Caenorhabditis briggsae TaxID=6238 RepID=A8X4T3_CAEBR|nr:Protein CBG07421 [Caenorhabditis briggsae]CAP27643.2 Protein CBG07421 [Caenorhabditis briggsae]
MIRILASLALLAPFVLPFNYNNAGTAACVVTKINEAFDKAEENEAKNATVPPMPIRPTLPSFCTGADTTMYIFGACTVQNNKVYIGNVMARELEEKEKGKLADFAKKLAAVTPGTAPPTDIYKGLEFCTEL